MLSMETEFFPLILLGAAVLLLSIFFYYVPFLLWISAKVSGVNISLIQLFLMRIRKVPPYIITRALIDAKVSGELDGMDNLLNFDLASGSTGITDMSTMKGTVADPDLFQQLIDKTNEQAEKIKSGEIKVVNAQIGEEFDPATCPRITTKTA